MGSARIVLEKATQYAFRTVEDLATLWCEWAEIELRHVRRCPPGLLLAHIMQNEPQRALEVLKAATRVPSPRQLREDNARVQTRVHRATKLWLFLADLQESLGALAAARAAYDQMIDLKVATAKSILNYARMLEENKYFEDAFKVRPRVLRGVCCDVCVCAGL